MSSIAEAIAALRRYWGYDSFRPLQERIVASLLGGHDSCVIMPTGGGKSLCYQLPAALQPGRTVIVVSPLIALMHDQMTQLEQMGISAGGLNSSLTGSEQFKITRQAEQGLYRLLYLSPERLSRPDKIPWLKRVPVSLFAIDEAHCISEWGHEFRPDYRQLSSLRTHFPDIPIAAFTASATRQVRHDIIDQLRLRNPHKYIASFHRSNLRYVIRECDARTQPGLLVNALRHYAGGHVIVYAPTINKVEQTVDFLEEQGIAAVPYHGQMESSLRTRNQERWMSDEVPVLVGTLAFGLGVTFQEVVHSNKTREADCDEQSTPNWKARMDIHKNARLTLIRREQLAQSVLLHKMTLQAAATAFNICARTAAKWTRRYQQQGSAGLYDRSSRPHRSPRRTGVALEQRVEQLRRQRFTGYHIAQTTGLSRATVSRILRRLGLNRMRDLEPAIPLIRYEHPAPGDMLHLDIKQLGRFAGVVSRPDGRRRGKLHCGWEYVHVAIDDHSRIAFIQILPNFNAACAIAFLRAAVAYYASLGIPIRRLLTDNGHCYRSHAFHAAVLELGLRHHFTRPYTPRTNGKAERFIQTALREWAYARLYQDSQQRQLHLLPWLHHYNWHRPHGSLDHAPPISRSGLDRNNLLRLHS